MNVSYFISCILFSLEEESDDDDQDDIQLQKQIDRDEDKATVITLPVVPSTVRDASGPDQQEQPPSDTIVEQLPEEPVRLTDPAETVAIAVIKSAKDPSNSSINGEIIPSKSPKSARKVVLQQDLHPPRQERPAESSSPGQRRKPESAPQGPQKPATTEPPKPELSQEVTEGELHILAGEMRSEKEWRILGQKLGISNAQMKRFSEDHADDITQCAAGVLKHWKKWHNNVNRERYILSSVLSDIGRDDLYALISTSKHFSLKD